MPEVNFAVVGAGLIGEVHARAYSSHPGANLLWVCDIDAARARRIARRYGARATTDLRRIARDGEVHAASVATPDFAHRAPVMALLRGGKHVLCEKPLAMKSAEARAMAREARRRGLHLMVNFHNRWNPLFIEAKKEIDSGGFGDLVVGYARMSNPYSVPKKMLSWAGRSGPEWFLMPHLLDLVLWLAGPKKTRSVHASGRKKILKSMGINSYDAVQAAVEFTDGSFCTLESAWVMPDAWPSIIDFKLSLQGLRGKIEVAADNQGISVTGKAHRTPFVIAEQCAFGKTTGFFQEPILHFVDALAEGRAPECPGEDGLVVTEVIEAAVRSIRTGRAVKLRKA